MAFGQYLIYRAFLNEQEITIPLEAIVLADQGEEAQTT